WGLREIPDSLPVERRLSLSAWNILQAYGRQMRNPVFMGYTLAGGFILGSLFTYISGSAFIFTQHFLLTPTQYGYLFAVNSVALVIGGQISNRMLKSGTTEQRTMYIGIIVHALAGFLLFLAVGSLGMVFGNLTALTMNNAGLQAGTASALMGTLHY